MPNFYPKDYNKDKESSHGGDENREPNENVPFFKYTNKDSLLMTLGNDEINWLLKELATSNPELPSNTLSDLYQDFEQNQFVDERGYDVLNDDESYTDLEDEILKQMNFSSG